MSSKAPQQADTWLARASSTGELEWETSFGDPAFDDYANSMIRLSDGTTDRRDQQWDAAHNVDGDGIYCGGDPW